MRVLVFGMTDNPGGVESFLLNYYRHIDKTKIQFDFNHKNMQKDGNTASSKLLGLVLEQ